MKFGVYCTIDWGTVNLRVTIFTGTEVDISVEVHQSAILNPMNIINWLEMIVPVMQ